MSWFSKTHCKDARATVAMQALNQVWGILQDPGKRAEYNRVITEAAINAEAKNQANHARAGHASMNKRRGQEVAASSEKKKRKTETETKEAKSKGSSASGAPAPPPESKFQFCILQQQKNAVLCKSCLDKSFHRKFENRDYAGASHAFAVAKEFQKAVEDMVMKHLSLTKLEQLKQFCHEHVIDIPDSGKLSKARMYDHVEEATYGKSGWSKVVFNFSIYCILLGIMKTGQDHLCACGFN